MSKLLNILCLSLLLSLHLKAQVQVQPYFLNAITHGKYDDRSSNTGYYSHNKKVLYLEDRGYLIKECFVNNIGERFETIVISRFDACHKLIWSKSVCSRIDLTIDGVYPYAAYLDISTSDLIRTQDSAVIFTFYHNVFYDFYRRGYYGVVTKIKDDGVVAWSQKLTVPDGYILDCINVAPAYQNGAMLFVNLVKISNGKNYLSTVDLGEKGNIRGVRTYENSNLGSHQTMTSKKLRKGGYALLQEDNTLIKFDDKGLVAWVRNMAYGRLDSSVIYKGLEEDENGNLYCPARLCTDYVERAFRRFSPFLIKVSPSGNKLFSKTYKTVSNGKGWTSFDGNITLTADGNLIWHEYGDNPNYHTVKFDPDGNIIWNKRYKHSDSGSYCFNVASTPDTGFITLTQIGDRTAVYKFDARGDINCYPSNEGDWEALNINSRFVNRTLNWVSLPITVTDTTVYTFDFPLKHKIICSALPVPFTDLGPDTVLCADTAIPFQLSSQNNGCKILWNTGDTTLQIKVKKTGRYWVTSSYGSCSDADTVQIVFPSKGLRTHTYSFCKGDSVRLSVPDSNLWDWIWVQSKKDSTGLPLQRTETGFWAKDTGTYLLLWPGQGGCRYTDTFALRHYPLPSATAGPDTLLCYNQSYTMQGAGGVVYKWTPAQYLSSDTRPDAIASPPQTQEYVLMVQNAQGCRDSARVWLKVRPPLFVTISGGPFTGCAGDSLSLEATGNGGKAGSHVFYWPGLAKYGPKVSFPVSRSGWQKVILTDSCSPDAADSVFIQIPSMPLAAFTYRPFTDIYAGTEISFINESQNAGRYFWSFGDGSNGSDQESPVHSYSDSGTFTVRLVASGKNGCSDTATAQVRVSDGIYIHIPNAFSPNGDGLNDLFQIRGTGIQEYSYSIYNRWGQLIFQSMPDYPYWNGAVHNAGVVVPEGVYMYVMKVKEVTGRMRYYSGTVHVE